MAVQCTVCTAVWPKIMNFSCDFAARLPIDSMIGQLNSTSQSAADDVKYCTIISCVVLYH